MWTEDDDVWRTLDDLMTNGWPLLNEYLSAMQPHKSELPPMAKALLFGGLGQLVVTYNKAREESNPPNLALALAFEDVVRNPLFNTLMGGSVNKMVDKKVDQIVEGEF
mgnify:CR=1 FL=1